MPTNLGNIKWSNLVDYLWQTMLIIASLIFFFFTISLMSIAFKHLGKTTVESILYTTSNPFIGLFIGLLITAIIQSSSTSTSMIVAVVATGSLTLENAVPMIMGANIGTTLTSSLVALSFVTNKRAFRRAVSAGVIHDFLNILLTLILLPLELLYGFLSFFASGIGYRISTIDKGLFNEGYLSILSTLTLASEKFVALFNNKILAVIISFILLLVSIKFLSRIIYRRLIGKSKENFRNYFFKNKFQSFSFGLILTSAVQSSSITTSLVVPLVANRTISLKNCFPYIVGANLGTTVTAFLAALFKNEAAISIAVIHFVFNFSGILLFLLLPFFKELPIALARYFSRKVQQFRYIGFAYVIILFFLLPFSLIYFNKDKVSKKFSGTAGNIHTSATDQDRDNQKTVKTAYLMD
ncbi:Na/Pi symporter [Fulvivirgaceae bacterium BMA12]|uniref:Na/Pi symporter n=1 Tax=Agaribacillus aureus TaxID=3051825 RepID=A0ABT8LDY2_9BACT|nr:Na/Pi symporter [Fulvivirgaceae bacterium BMA12]